MSQTSKALRRLCIATGAVTVAGVLPVLAAIPAFASNVTGATLSINPTTNAATSTGTVTFVTDQQIPAGGTITINSYGNPAAEAFANNPADYNVTSSNGATDYNAATTPAVASASQVVLTTTNAIPAGDTVTVTAAGETNPTNASVYFAVGTSADTTAVDTNSVTIGNGPTAGAIAVTQVNPNTLPEAGNVPVTIRGTDFSTTATTTVNFVVHGTAITVAATNVTVVSPTEIRATAPALPAATSTASTNTPATYDVQVVQTTSGVTQTSPIGLPDQVQAVSGLTYVPESGARVLDTRSGRAIPRGMIPANGQETVTLASLEAAGNIPASATAVAMNVTAIGETGPGNIQLSTNGSTPGTSTVNFTPGVDTGNFTILSTPLTTYTPTGGVSTTNNAQDTVTIQDQGSAVDLTFDVVGYFTGTGFTPVANGGVRVLDSRPGAAANAGGGVINGPLASRQIYRLQVGNTAGTIVALNVTAVDPTQVGNLRVFPEPSGGASVNSVPNTAAVQYVPGTDSGSYLITQTGNGGYIDLYSDSTGTVNAVIDETGTVTKGTPAAPNLVTNYPPFRDYDSRPAGLASDTAKSVTIGNTGTFGNGVPAGAFGAVVSVSDINPGAVGNIRTYPDGASIPSTATINNYVGHDRENLAIVALNSGVMDLYNDSTAGTNATVDVLGYIGY